MNVGIIGLGFVGSALCRKFNEKYKTYNYDKMPEKSNSNLVELVEKCSIIFICLPTPSKKNGDCNLDSIFHTFQKLQNLGYSKICVLKSTILPGTTAKINKDYPKIKTIHNPEFLRERYANEDFNNQTKVILGGKKSVTKVVANVYKSVFDKVNIIHTSSVNSEMVKYYINTFLSNKVSFANEMYQFCKKLKIEYKEVLRHVLTDDRIGKSHLDVPGFDNKFGFGGHCLPKDLDALID